MEDNRPGEPRPDPTRPRPRRNVPMRLLVLGLVVMGFFLFSQRSGGVAEITIFQLDEHIAENQVDRLTIVGGTEIVGDYRDDRNRSAIKDPKFHVLFTGPKETSSLTPEMKAKWAKKLGAANVREEQGSTT